MILWTNLWCFRVSITSNICANPKQCIWMKSYHNVQNILCNFLHYTLLEMVITFQINVKRYVQIYFCNLPSAAKTFKHTFSAMQVIMDYELAIHNAVLLVWLSNVRRNRGSCFEQTLYKKNQKLGIFHHFRNKDSSEGKWLRCLCSLQYL